jgi:hypothetical protein
LLSPSLHFQHTLLQSSRHAKAPALPRDTAPHLTSSPCRLRRPLGLFHPHSCGFKQYFARSLPDRPWPFSSVAHLFGNSRPSTTHLPSIGLVIDCRSLLARQFTTCCSLLQFLVGARCRNWWATVKFPMHLAFFTLMIRALMAPGQTPWQLNQEQLPRSLRGIGAPVPRCRLLWTDARNAPRLGPECFEIAGP